MVEACLLFAALLLGSANGANDNFKGVATLYGSGILSYRASVRLATLATVLGSMAALLLGFALTASFSGKGFVPDDVAAQPVFMLAVGAAAATTVMVASRVGFPVSTTHALLGALVGAGLVQAGDGLQLSHFARVMAAPLLLSPLLAFALVRLASFLVGPPGAICDQAHCLCVGSEPLPAAEGVVALASGRVALTIDESEACAVHSPNAVVALSVPGARDLAHCASAALVCFSRALNDTPKLLPFLLAARLATPSVSLIAMTGVVALGGVVAGRRVADTMAHRITSMQPREALAGNLATSCLVLLASALGLPVSTTHVACGSLIAVGVGNRGARWRVIGTIGAAWLVTAPVAAVLSATVASLLR